MFMGQMLIMCFFMKLHKVFVYCWRIDIEITRGHRPIHTSSTIHQQSTDNIHFPNR